MKRLIAESREIKDMNTVITNELSAQELHSHHLHKQININTLLADYTKYGFVIHRENDITYYYIECYQVTTENSLIVYCSKRNNHDWSNINSEVHQELNARQFKALKDITINGTEVHLTTAKTFTDLQNNAIR